MKRYFTGLLAILIAIALTSFGNNKPQKPSSLFSYRFIGVIYDDASYDNPNNWVLDLGGLFCGAPGPKLCTIDAQPDLWNIFIPDFSGLDWWDHVRSTVNTSVVCNRKYKF